MLPAKAAPSPLSRTILRDRHGRGVRPENSEKCFMTPTHPHPSFFDLCVAESLKQLRALWPAELSQIRVSVMPMPPDASAAVQRWQVFPSRNQIVLYRLAILRLTRLHQDDDWHRRSLIESCVFCAVAELLGKDPLDIPTERDRHF